VIAPEARRGKEAESSGKAGIAVAERRVASLNSKKSSTARKKKGARATKELQK